MISVEIRCRYCLAGAPVVGISDGRIRHAERVVCDNWDEECRHIGEPFGFYTFAWKPVRCRNGRWRWLRSVEKHDDGTYTLGNRAH